MITTRMITATFPKNEREERDLAYCLRSAVDETTLLEIILGRDHGSTSSEKKFNHDTLLKASIILKRAELGLRGVS